jgi:digeranylgeranylglycerophospholipid reductase
MRERFDVVIVGAGPAGSTCARVAAGAGLSVLVLEKDREVGTPVRCGEAVSDSSLGALVDIDPRWIAGTIKRFRLVSPSGLCVEPDIGGQGYVLERRLFDSGLVALAADRGAEIRTSAYVDGLLHAESDNDVTTWQGVTYQWNGERHEAEARVIVGADGVESRVGRWAGIDTVTPMRDMETCAQATLTNIDLDEHTCEFHFGEEVAPMGYLWVFPKGRGTANVGVGISGTASKQRSALRYLQDFLSRRFPGATVLTTVAGGVPCATTVAEPVKGNVVLVGDAAHQVNPMTGGGITSGMLGGKLAGEAITDALRNGDLHRLHRYPERWRREWAAKHETYHRMKTAVYKFPDSTLDDIARNVLKLPEQKRTIWGVFSIALRKHPALVWEMIKTFGLQGRL